ncbi:unnamed protein product [Ambrosiozyma monospora]|uniref:RING-type E3 ubiquitin transferase n=1 Tax=Ambrosiozyma monospora TaxID=43982 RepID=A0A9W6Z2E3_AMBMO|nr:unnamed protein product [Ambrosiozyma monospora]
MTVRAPTMAQPANIMFSYLGKSFSDEMCSVWQWVFKVVAAQLRLSSFLLDNDKPSERGHVVYRNLYYRLFCFEAPDYSNPTADFKAKEFFAENPNVNCCFVPDGSYVRAPDDDQVARKFVKQLFVPVTKNDDLLAPIPEIDPREEEVFNPYGDDEPMDHTTYMIVYRPPMFHTRIYTMFTYLWFFSLSFTFIVYLSSITVGRFVYGSIFSILFAGLDKSKNSDPFLFKNMYQLDLGNMICGMFVLKYGYKSVKLVYTTFFVNDGTIDRLVGAVKAKVSAKLSHVLPKIRRAAGNVFPHLRDSIIILYSIFCTTHIIINCIAGPLCTIEAKLITDYPHHASLITLFLQIFGITFGIMNCVYLWGGEVNERNNIPFRKFPRYVMLASIIVLSLYCLFTGKPMNSLPGIYSDGALVVTRIQSKEFNFNNVVFLVLWYAYVFAHVSHSIKNYLNNVSVEMKEEIYGNGRVLTNFD